MPNDITDEFIHQVLGYEALMILPVNSKRSRGTRFEPRTQWSKVGRLKGKNAYIKLEEISWISKIIKTHCV